MKTSCPICGFETEVEDKKIRKRGREVTCPRCEHTYFVERSTYGDIDRIGDSAGSDIITESTPAAERSTYSNLDRIEDTSGLDIVEEVRLAVERKKRGEEEKMPAVDRGSSGENNSSGRMVCLSIAIVLGVYGVLLISDGDIRCGILSIIGAIASLLATIFWKRIVLYIWEGWTDKDNNNKPLKK